MQKTKAIGQPGNRRRIQALRMTAFALVFVSWLAVNLRAQDEEAWSTDAKAATTQASLEKKDMLLLFTGSDWCPPCIKLDKQVLGTSDFIYLGQSEFILV